MSTYTHGGELSKTWHTDSDYFLSFVYSLWFLPLFKSLKLLGKNFKQLLVHFLVCLLQLNLQLEGYWEGWYIFPLIKGYQQLEHYINRINYKAIKKGSQNLQRFQKELLSQHLKRRDQNLSFQ